jgi:hypothetical protein
LILAPGRARTINALTGRLAVKASSKVVCAQG